jgi:hypothetical protein
METEVPVMSSPRPYRGESENEWLGIQCEEDVIPKPRYEEEYDLERDYETFHEAERDLSDAA